MMSPHATLPHDSRRISPVDRQLHHTCVCDPAETPAGEISYEAQLLLACTRTRVDAFMKGKIRALAARGIDFSSLIARADKSFVLSLLCRNLLTASSDLMPSEVRTQMTATLRGRERLKLRQTGELLRIVRLLNANGIRVLPFKGPVLSAQLYGSISLRDFADLDILVHPSDFHGARSVLNSNGYADATPRLWIEQVVPALSRRKDQVLQAADSGARVELHRRLSGGHFTLPISDDDIWLHLDTVDIAGLPINCLPPVMSLLYLCMHGSRHGWERLQWICDVAEFLRVHSDLDWKRVWAEAHSLRNERNLALGLYLAHELLSASLPGTVLQRITADPEVTSLAAQVRVLLFAEQPARPDISYWRNYHLRVTERSRDRMRLRLHYCRRYLSLFTKPRAHDRSLVHLPRPFDFLHYLLRPARLLVRYGMLWKRNSRISSAVTPSPALDRGFATENPPPPGKESY